VINISCIKSIISPLKPKISCIDVKTKIALAKSEMQKHISESFIANVGYFKTQGLFQLLL